MTSTVTPDGMGVPADDAAPDPAGRGLGGLQRELVDAAVRGVAPTTAVDHAGLAVAVEDAARLVAALDSSEVSWAVQFDEVTVTVPPALLVRTVTWLRDEGGYALLSDVSPCDRYGSEHAHPARFNVDYVITKLQQGAPRVRVRVWVNEGETLESVMPVYPTADWHEREAWDFFGIEFTGREGLRRIIMPEDWVGHPLRKDYPIGGEPVTFTNSAREID